MQPIFRSPLEADFDPPTTYDLDFNLKQTVRYMLRAQREQKEKECIINCNNLIYLQQYTLAASFLKDLIKDSHILVNYEFKGVGNEQSWLGYQRQGAIGWFTKMYKRGQFIMNIFDILSLCFQLILTRNPKRFGEVCQWYEKKIQSEEGYEVYFGLANLFYNRKKYVKAEYYYQKSLRLNNKFAKTYEYLGWIYSNWFGYDSQALQYASKAYQLDPSSQTCKLLVAICQQLQDRKQMLLQQIINQYPNYYRTYFYFGQLQRDKTAAEHYYKKCLYFDNKYKMAHLKLGYLQKFAQNYYQAIKLYVEIKKTDQFRQDSSPQTKEVLDLDRLKLRFNFDKIKIYSIIAKNYKDEGQISKAVIYMHKHLKQNPQDYQSINRLGLYYAQQQEIDQAIFYFQKAAMTFTQIMHPSVEQLQRYKLFAFLMGRKEEEKDLYRL